MSFNEKRILIKQLFPFGWSVEQVAAAPLVTPPTLHKHYFREQKSIEEVRFSVEAKRLQVLMTKPEAGDISTIDKYIKRFEQL